MRRPRCSAITRARWKPTPPEFYSNAPPSLPTFGSRLSNTFGKHHSTLISFRHTKKIRPDRFFPRSSVGQVQDHPIVLEPWCYALAWTRCSDCTAHKRSEISTSLSLPTPTASRSNLPTHAVPRPCHYCHDHPGGGGNPNHPTRRPGGAHDAGRVHRCVAGGR